MNGPSKRRSIAVTAAIVIAVVFLVLQSGLLVVFGGASGMDGTVLAIARGTGGEEEATVKLNWGPTVRASVPPACLVFGGQIATVHFTGLTFGEKPSFQLWESRD